MTAALKYRSSRQIVTVVGEVNIERKYYRCAGVGGCKCGVVPFDDWAGMGKGCLTIGARRLACLAASSWSFDKSSQNLVEFCGLHISDQTIRRVADEEGLKIFDWMETAYAATTKFTHAQGQIELLGDGTMVNTREGWKEMRVTLIGKRKPGPSVDPCAWENIEHRHLPASEARLVSARFADSEQMGRVWKAQATRLGLGNGEGVSVLADGAKWIWSKAGEALPLAEQVVDIYHLSEHVHQCAGVLLGEHTAEAAAWAGTKIMDLARHGAAPTLHELDGVLASWEKQKPADQRALRGLIGYIGDNQTRMPYADRLRRGLPIGSGQIEGACKTVVGRRLKLNSARWQPERAQHLAAHHSAQYSDLWPTYWESKAA